MNILDIFLLIYLIPFIIAYYLWVLALPILVAQLLIFMLTKHFGWKLKKKHKWLWIILLASILITYPWFSIVEDIEGRVVDVTGQPIEGILITALWEYEPIIRVTSIFSGSSYAAQAREAVTDKDGRYHIYGFTYLPSFNQKLMSGQPKVRFYQENLRVDYNLSKYKYWKGKFSLRGSIVRKSLLNGLDVVMVKTDNGSGNSGTLWGFVKSVLSEDNDNCMWANIPVAITREYKTVKRGIQISEDTVKFGRHSLPRNMEKCGVDIGFFKGLSEWNIKILPEK
ncbi:MAG: carboxypeptidase-like regulatory domain-containing protein [Xanthomonadales bacterium]|nr:carboxypeptidase-like regulatory domain-containing protein [Xanthomonadales bacterium]